MTFIPRAERLFAAILVVPALAIASAPAPAHPPSPQVPRLTVLLGEPDGPGLSAEDGVARINAAVPDFASRDLRARTGSPTKARFLLGTRLPASMRAQLAKDHPLEVMHRWIVLDYPDNAAASLARAAMASAPAVFRRVDEVQDSYRPSFVPGYSLYNYSQSPIGSSAAGVSSAMVHSIMGVNSAWDMVTGSAYVGVYDLGVDGADFTQASPTVHPGLVKNVRGHFSFDSADHTANVDERACNFQGPDGQFYNVGGHGTHVSGLIAATGDSFGIGTSGVCPTCSLAIVRHGFCQPAPDDTQATNAWMEAFRSGMQVLNFSGGYYTGAFAGTGDPCTGATPPAQCTALALASSLDIAFVASSGNTPDMHQSTPQFPAREPGVISAGSTNEFGQISSFSATGKVDFAVPSERVFSTFATNRQWIYVDVYGLAGSTCERQSPTVGDPLNQYGYCTGTSMSAPLVTGSYALVKSADPLMPVVSVTSLLREFATYGYAISPTYGSGAPNVGASVNKAIWGAYGNKGLTPLFSLTTPGSRRHFYTTVPQMAMGANCMGLKGGLHGWLANEPYDATNLYDVNDGTRTAGYYSFPTGCHNATTSFPVASFKVFTTTTRFGQSLVPLYRMSWNSAPQGSTPQYDNAGNGGARAALGHAYATSAAEVQGFRAVPYMYDGIEGYLYSSSSPQPAGTVAVYRRYSAARDDYALLTPAQLTTVGAGYAPIGNGYMDIIGYACPNVIVQSGVCADASSIQVYAVAGKVDFNGDGHADLAWNRGAMGQLSIAGGNPSFQTTPIYSPTGEPGSIHKVADFNGDGKSDILWRMADGRYYVSLQNGYTSVSSAKVLDAGSGWEAVATADLNGDGNADIIWYHPTYGYGAWLMSGTGILPNGANNITNPGSGWKVVAIGDFDGDGKADILWSDPAGVNFKFILMNGLTAVPGGASANIVTDGTWSVTHVGDLNGDTRADVIWRRTDGTAGAWLMNGTSTFPAGNLVSPGPNFRIAAVADFNGDHWADILWSDDLTTVQVGMSSLVGAPGTFNITSIMSPPMSYSGNWVPIGTADINGDTKADIIWRRNDGLYGYWLMNGGTLLYAEGLLTPASGWEMLKQ